MAIPAGTTVKFSLDWTHLGATYVHHTYSREDLIFFEITGPALIVDLSPGEELPDASAGTHLASVGITQAAVYNWYDILQYPAYGPEAQAYKLQAIFKEGSIAQFKQDVVKGAEAPGVDSIFNWRNETTLSNLINSNLFAFGTTVAIDSLFKLPPSISSGAGVQPLNQRTLRNMPYTSTLIIE